MKPFFSLIPLARYSGLALLAGCTILGLAGCAGYTLGPSNGVAAGEKSVQVAPFANRTVQPHLTDAVTAQVRKALQKDGTYQLATHDDGDIVVTGTLLQYTRQEITFVPSDVVTVRDYRLVLTAHVIARNRTTGVVVLDQNVNGSTLMRVSSDMTNSERQALPLLAADLARNITGLLVDGSW
jgi:hypothetical protein